MASESKLGKVERESKLEKVGREAFDILEQVIKKEKRPSQSKPPVQGTQPKKNDAVIDSHQAVQAYGGALIGGYDSYKPAKAYGGAQIGYWRSRPKPTRWAF